MNLQKKFRQFIEEFKLERSRDTHLIKELESFSIRAFKEQFSQAHNNDNHAALGVQAVVHPKNRVAQTLEKKSIVGKQEKQTPPVVVELQKDRYGNPIYSRDKIGNPIIVDIEQYRDLPELEHAEFMDRFGGKQKEIKEFAKKLSLIPNSNIIDLIQQIKDRLLELYTNV